MGCYLSTVDDKVYLTEGKGKNYKWATASCQGWRREQEDAEACITDFDENASLFVLCDGHGGAEVAKYTVAHLPDFIKNHELYKSGDYKKALEQAFIDFDALLRTDDVMSELKKLAFDEEETKDDEKGATKTDAKVELEADTSAGPSASCSGAGSGSSSGYQTASTSGSCSTQSNGASSIAEDVDTDTLRREAQVPIAELMLKYAEALPKSRVQSLRHSALGASPVIRNREAGDEQEPKASSSGSNDDPAPSSSKSNSIDDSLGPSSGSFPLQSNLDILKKAIEKHFSPEEDDSEDDSEFEASDDSDDDSEDDEDAASQSDTEDDSDENEDDGDDEGDADSDGKRCKVLSKKHKRSLKNRAETTSSDEESEEEDWQSEEDEEDGSEDDDDDDDDGGDLLSKGLLSVAKFRQSMKAGTKTHTPGMDSGCTVVVALVKDGELYVASAGDSRCIVVRRDGKCVPMSFDHKPENHTELKRIARAGGFVSEGRVNGGLNLSRAFGDFTYKNAKLAATEQMITPCPDVKTTPIDPKEVGYIFLACDGIWNSMKNYQVAMFIRQTEPRVNDLSDVCAALFKECLAPTTDGDGTGCDNMTCILVKYDNPNEEQSSTDQQTDLKSTTKSDENKKAGDEEKGVEKGESAIKRQAETESVEDSGHHNKKRCLRLLESEVLLKELPLGSSISSSMAMNIVSEQLEEDDGLEIPEQLQGGDDGSGH